ncbi:MAG: putative hemolysin, partial [Porticoccaceae bacterium]
MEIELIIITVSILLSAFFSGMEIAFVSANKMHIELEKKRDGFIPKILRIITQKSSKFITTMLVGNNISLVIYSYYMGEFLVRMLPLNSFNEFSILLIQTIISTIVILVTAEFLPKAIFRIYANEVLKIFAIPAYIFYYLFHFFSEFITIISDFFLRVFFKTNAYEEQTEFSKEELGNYINEQLETGNVDYDLDSEIQIFQNALQFQNVKAREVMVPRTEIVSVEIHETVSNLKNAFIKTGLSKILVYKSSLDDVVGYVNAFELFKNPKTIKSILLPLELVPESMMINDILNTLIKKRKSVAIVIDEYGGTSGMITVEDIVEELFGEIEDEHDSQEFLEEKIN